MWNFLKSIKTLYLLDRLDERRETSMHSKYILANNRSNRKEVEKVCKKLPNYSITIFVLTFHIEAIILCDCSQLMIASDKKYFSWVFEF